MGWPARYEPDSYAIRQAQIRQSDVVELILLRQKQMKLTPSRSWPPLDERKLRHVVEGAIRNLRGETGWK